MKDLFSRIRKSLSAGRDQMPVTTAIESTASPALLIAEALQFHRLGQLVDAERIYLQVLTLDPDNFDAVHLLGVLAQQAGKGDRAIELIGRAVVIRPDEASARGNLGLAYRHVGQIADAEASLRRAVELNPLSDLSHVNLGVVMRDLGDLAGAEEQFNTALHLNPANDDASNNLANLYCESGRPDQAEALYRNVLTSRPERVDFWNSLAALCLAQGRWTDAEHCLRSTIDRSGPTAESLNNLGYVNLQLGRLQEAMDYCRAALEVRADYPDAWVNLALVQKAASDMASAEASCQRALAIDAGHIAANVNLGTIQREQNNYAAAETSYRRALRSDAHSSAARFNLGSLLLLRGAYPEGFALFESRFEIFRRQFNGDLAESFLDDTTRRWRGEPLAGKRIVIWGEQGNGDNLMMLRYMPLLKQRGGTHVTFVGEPGLARIAAAVGGVDAVVPWDHWRPSADFDMHCPSMSLPGCFGTTLATIPAGWSYVDSPHPSTTGRVARLSGDTRLRVGLAWAGNPGLRDDSRRSIALHEFEAVVRIPDVQCFSLQKGSGAEQAVAWPSVAVEPIEACSDFMDTASLIRDLDLVISVDTAIAHLAGAVGKPVWLLNRAGSEWRWGVAGNTSPWYPTMRIFRQQDAFDWMPVMTEVTAELKNLIASGRERHV